MIRQLNFHPIEFILTALLFTGLVHLLLLQPYNIYHIYHDKATYAQVHDLDKGEEYGYVYRNLAIIAFSIVGMLIIYLRLKKPLQNIDHTP
jgi:hypothetical protein